MKFYIFIPFFQPPTNPSFIHPNPEMLDSAYAVEEIDKAILKARQRDLFESASFNSVRKDQYRLLFVEFDAEVYAFSKRN